MTLTDNNIKDVVKSLRTGHNVYTIVLKQTLLTKVNNLEKELNDAKEQLENA
tara:strand:- start:1067 stop:1222 length:156 start_codon:yes stop_codon:yes gene_type:complete